MMTTFRSMAGFALCLAAVAACSDDSGPAGDDAAKAVTDMIHIPLCIPGDEHMMHGDHDHDAGTDESDAGHSHATCGLHENCTDVVTLEDGLTVDGHDGNYSVVVKSHTDLGATDNHWMADVVDKDGNKRTDVKVVLSTWSVDCMHKGPTPDEIVEADSDGMYMLMPVTAHGGPWEVRLMITDGEVDESMLDLAAGGSGHNH